MNRYVTQWEHEQASKLLDELNEMVGSKSPTPRQYQDWNSRAQIFLVFAACRRIGNGDMESVGLKSPCSPCLRGKP